MEMSHWGARMARPSGLRAIMEDIATTMADGSGAQWLNLSIGNPAPIPEVVALWRQLTRRALADGFESRSCGYGASRGDPALLQSIADCFNRRFGWQIAPENIVVAPGSQMICFMAAALFAGQGRRGQRRIVLPVAPDYTGYHGLAMAPGGLTAVPGRLHRLGPRRFRYSLDMAVLEHQQDVGLMMLSSPANPTGRACPPHELADLIAFAERRRVPLLLDNAYGAPFPRLAPSPPPPHHPSVINTFSLSKAGLPGERIGFAIAAPEIAAAMTSFLSAAALHAPRLAQETLRLALESGDLESAAAGALGPHYLAKRVFAEDRLGELLPASLNWRLHEGEGGMFCWLWINEPDFDDLAFYRLLKHRGVFVVPGRHFFSDLDALDGHCTRCIRLSLSANEATIGRGIELLAAALKESRRAAVA